jgi:hypothetical protein
VREKKNKVFVMSNKKCKKTKVERVSKNMYILPSTKDKIEKLASETGFQHGQIVDLALGQVSKKWFLNKALNVKQLDIQSFLDESNLDDFPTDA